jgi:hypothetical protein
MKRKYQDAHHNNRLPQKRLASESSQASQDTEVVNRDELHHFFEEVQRLLDVFKNRSIEPHQKSKATTDGTYDGGFHSPRSGESQDAQLLSLWLDEWQTAPDDPFPSSLKPLSLLQESVDINETTHVRNVKESPLQRHYPRMPPEETIEKVLSRAKKAEEEEDWERDSTIPAPGPKRSERRQEMDAMKHTDGIISTGDNATTSEEPRPPQLKSAQHRAAMLYPAPPTTDDNTISSEWLDYHG